MPDGREELFQLERLLDEIGRVEIGHPPLGREDERAS
jgi:hypothetical protein